MDLNEQDLAELEERLYSSIHHAETVDTAVGPSSGQQNQLLPTEQPPAEAPVRIVTDKSVINDARQNQQKIKRYWTSIQRTYPKLSYPGIQGPRPQRAGPPNNSGNSGGRDSRGVGEAAGSSRGGGAGEAIGAPVVKRVFRPYQSILGPQSGGTDSVLGLEPMMAGGDIQGGDRQKKKKSSQGDGKAGGSSSGIRNEIRSKKLEQLKKIKEKKTKAQKSRQKAYGGQHRLVATIELDTSDEEEGEYHSPDPVKQESKDSEIQKEELEDSDPDEVVLIPSAPPPLVCIEDSDDELAKDGFTQPKSKRKKNASKKINSPRCISPSNSSIMSDDFIGHQDRVRLNDSFIEGIANDEELDFSAPHTVASFLAGERRDPGDSFRQGRAPSISSDGTVATSSDTTDHDKQNSLNKILDKANSSGPRICSTPKQTLALKKSSTSSKPQKDLNDDSIYSATVAKKSKTTPAAVPEKRPSCSTSDDSGEDGNVSSHSKRSRSYLSDTSSSSKKRRKKRRKQNSQHYSDEDFASMLSNIVQEISENEDEDSSTEQEPHSAEPPPPGVDEDDVDDEEEPTMLSTASEKTPSALHVDTSNDILEIKDQEPNEITLPQIEPREKYTPTVTEDKNTSSPVTPIENPLLPPPPPVINLTADNISTSNRQPKEAEKQTPHQVQVQVQRMISESEDDSVMRSQQHPEGSWNDEMRKFYNESWNCEDFNISTVLFNMPRLSKNWPIVHKDKYPDPPKKEIICNNCGERGHMRYKCRGPPKPKSCYMCGMMGHQEPRCPNTLCLRCGEKTKNFLRGCQSCAREQNMSCHMCGVRGHTQRNCPDKWRRYHSTIEDNKPLTQQYARNPNAKHCCICTRPGHQAHGCNAALKIFGQLVPTTEVKNYKPIYQNDTRFRKEDEDGQGEKFQLFSQMAGDYEFNFDPAFALNESSFYNRFAKAVGILRKKKKREDRLARKMSREAKKRKREEGGSSEVIIVEEDANQSVAGRNESNVVEVGEDQQQQKQVEGGPKSANEDSNYSFSEFYEDRSTVNLPQQSSDVLPDYIPLISTTQHYKETPVLVPAEEQKTDARIFLTKPHAKILLSPDGAAFLKEASTKFTLQLSIAFQSVGNVLLANGLPSLQDNFHNELVKFLNDKSHQNQQLNYINNVPRTTEKTIHYIIGHLGLLTRRYPNIYHMYKRYQNLEQNGANPKTCDKIRRSLNIMLFGQLGMRDGRDHLNKLQFRLEELKKTKDVNVPSDCREDINQHIRYIFTAYDHADYEVIMKEYDVQRKSHQLQRLNKKDLNLAPWPPRSPATEKPNEPTNEGDPAPTQGFEDDDLTYLCDFDKDNDDEGPPEEDLILNTSDQMLDESKNYNEQSQTPQNNLPSGSNTSNSTLTSAQAKDWYDMDSDEIEELVKKCRQLCQSLNKEKQFKHELDKMHRYARRGRLAKKQCRMLVQLYRYLSKSAAKS